MKKNIKMLTGITAMALSFSNILIPVTANANAEQRTGDIMYIIRDDHIDITGCDTQATDIVIPSEIDGITVTGIQDWAFRMHDNLNSVDIPDSVTNIGEQAFYGCENLMSITLPDSITSIGDSAFSYCRWHLTSITLPDSLTSINNTLFYGCENLRTVTIPDSVTSIGSMAFADCTYLESVNIPDGITVINSNVFMGCENLMYIDIPESVTSINQASFYGCERLMSIEIPESVEYIGKSAFYGCKSLKSIEIPYNVTSIDNMAFQNCTSLKSITIYNPECEIYDGEIKIADTDSNYNGTIYGYEDSTAQKYAEKYGYKFKKINSQYEIIKGDLNSDGKVNIADAVLMNKFILGENPEIPEWKSADLNDDNVVDSFDMCLIRRMII